MKTKNKPKILTGKLYNSVQELIEDALPKSKFKDKLLKDLKEDEKIYKDYPWIFGLGIKIYFEEKVPYVLGEDIHKVLNKKQSKKYSEFFGCQTGILTKDGKCACYPWDVEACLARVLTGKLEGTQLYWD